jgi:hypothetical protein
MASLARTWMVRRKVEITSNCRCAMSIAPVRAVDLVTGHRFLVILPGDAALKHYLWPGRGANSGSK